MFIKKLINEINIMRYYYIITQMYKQLADEYILKAKDMALKTGFFDTLFTSQEEIFDDAASLYIKAGNQYKLAKLWKNAGDAFYEASLLLQKNKDIMENVRLQNAAECYSLLPHDDINFELIKLCLINAINILDGQLDNTDFNKIGKLYEILGDYFENSLESVKYYEDSVKYYDACTSSNYTKQQCMIKLAKLYVNNKIYDKGGQLFEQLAELRSNSKIMQTSTITDYHLITYLTNMLLCKIGYYDIIGLKKCIDKCNVNYPDYIKTPEYESMCSLCDAIEFNNIDKFKRTVEQFPNNNLEQWKLDILSVAFDSIDCNNVNDFS